MNQTFGYSVLVDILQNITAITNKLDTFVVGTTTYPAIFSGRMLPALYQDLNKTLQIYRNSPVGSGEYNEITYTINCRQTNEQDAETLAKLVYNATNRVFDDYSGSVVYLRSRVNNAILEEENCWNCPVDIRMGNSL